MINDKILTYSIPEAQEIISKFLITKTKLNANYSKQYTELKDYFQKVLKAESYIDVKTCMHHIVNETEISTCDTCGKQTPVYNFSKPHSKRFCDWKCKHAYNHENHIDENIFTDYNKLIDKFGNISQSKIVKYMSKNSIEYLKNKTEIKTDDLKTLIYIQLYGTEKLKYCKECGKLINIRWCTNTPYTEDKTFCSAECTNKNQDYRDNISTKKKGKSRHESDSYVNNVSIPWFYEKLQKLASDENISIDVTFDEYLKNDVKTKYKCTCKLCNHTFQYVLVGKIAFCPKCNLFSKPQKALVDFINSLGITELMINDRTIIKPYELDIYIPELKIAIEYDGLYFHQDKNDFHKYEMCKELGIRLIKIFDDDNIDIVKSRLATIINKTQTKIFARKCIIKTLSADIYSEFMRENHIQGSVPAMIKLGLYYNDELVGAMSFGSPRYAKKFEWELLRYASKRNVSITGGASKLFQYFIKNHTPNSVISYCDVRYGTGNMYLHLGFKFYEHTKCNYYWYKGKRESRIKFQKHKLPGLFPNVDMSMTEDQILRLNGYTKIYDFGNYVFHYIK